MLLLAATTSRCDEESPGQLLPLYPPDTSIAGRSCSQLVAEWWAWELSIPRSSHPLFVEGADCGQNQPDDVFFLATNRSGTETFHCEVPAYTPIVAPMLVNVFYTCPEVYDDDCVNGDPEVLPTLAASGFEGYTIELGVELDGEPVDETLEDYFCAGDMFRITEVPDASSVIATDDVECAAPFPEDNVCGFEAGPRHTVAAGYFVGVKPLEPGYHTLRLWSCADDSCRDKTFQLTVVDPAEQ